jgi:hypothetical protein
VLQDALILSIDNIYKS